MSLDDVYGHTLSRKSEDLDRDTFIFINLHQSSRLFLGVNQKLTPITSATLHRWVRLMSRFNEPEIFFLCPVSVHPAGIMSYYVVPSGPPIEPYSTEPIPPGNYGWYFDRECRNRGFPELTEAPQRFVSFKAWFCNDWLHNQRLKMDPLPPAVEQSVTARDGRHCRFTGLTNDISLAWIVPPAISWETDDFGSDRGWDAAPFFVAANVLTMHQKLVHYFHSNYFAVDVDGDYQILIFRAMDDLQALLPTHLPPHAAQDAAADTFLRHHCRYSLSVMIRGGDIGDDYSNSSIVSMMDQLGVRYIGGEALEDRTMEPLTDERWHSPLGQAILKRVLEHRVVHSEQSVSEPTSPDSDEPPSQPPYPDSKSAHDQDGYWW
ncbi:hypothetical protein C8R43DRAFT_1239391 [Mycena crocata]|nr:hypothetical protein C8R43DRAFT_1241406 [Mycena crocata]KAJ7133887.1 hypothetical protein C8R43DRAFT_1239391 [Mycena crocata]